MRARFYDFGREEHGRVSTRPVHKGCDGQLRIVPTNELEIGHSGFILADSVPPTVGDWRISAHGYPGSCDLRAVVAALQPRLEQMPVDQVTLERSSNEGQHPRKCVLRLGHSESLVNMPLC